MAEMRCEGWRSGAAELHHTVALVSLSLPYVWQTHRGGNRFESLSADFQFPGSTVWGLQSPLRTCGAELSCAVVWSGPPGGVSCTLQGSVHVQGPLSLESGTRLSGLSSPAHCKPSGRGWGGGEEYEQLPSQLAGAPLPTLCVLQCQLAEAMGGLPFRLWGGVRWWLWTVFQKTRCSSMSISKHASLRKISRL